MSARPLGLLLLLSVGSLAQARQGTVYTVRSVAVRPGFASVPADLGIKVGDQGTEAQLESQANEARRAVSQAFGDSGGAFLDGDAVVTVVLVTQRLSLDKAQGTAAVVFDVLYLRIDPTARTVAFSPGLTPRGLTGLAGLPGGSLGLLSDRRYGQAGALALHPKTGERMAPLDLDYRQSFRDAFHDLKLGVAKAQGQGYAPESRAALAYVDRREPLGGGTFAQRGGTAEYLRDTPIRGVLHPVIGAQMAYEDANGRGGDATAGSLRTEFVADLAGPGYGKLALWGEGGGSGGAGYAKVAARGAYSVDVGGGAQTFGVELDLGAGGLAGSPPNYLRYFGGQPLGEFILASPLTTGYLEAPAGPALRGVGRNALAFPGGRGGRAYGFASASVAIPVPAWSRKLVPDLDLGFATLPELMKKTVGPKSQARAVVLEQFKKDHTPEEAEALTRRTFDRDIQPAVDYLADRAVVYAVKPLLFAEYGVLGSSGVTRDSFGVGGGLQLSIVSARGEIGYVRNVGGALRDSGNWFFRLTFAKLF